ncbi:unnamed protein product, partial [Gongylonema pulchrum]
MLKPCANGLCSNTFNDFECHCEYSWAGKRCNERDHCALNSCGTNVTCTNHDGGYVCSSPATFIPSSFAKYKLLDGISTDRSIPDSLQISFLLRTRSGSGQIIYLKAPNAFLSLSLRNGLLIYEALVDGDVKKRSSDSLMNDGVMHNIVASSSGLYIDGKLSGTKSLPFPKNLFESTQNL